MSSLDQNDDPTGMRPHLLGGMRMVSRMLNGYAIDHDENYLLSETYRLEVPADIASEIMFKLQELFSVTVNTPDEKAKGIAFAAAALDKLDRILKVGNESDRMQYEELIRTQKKQAIAFDCMLITLEGLEVG